MNRLRFRRTLGIFTVASAFGLAGCYTFSGGGGFPKDVRTLYIEPFENQTPQVELDQQLFRALTDTLPRSLGVRPGNEENADAIVRGKIVRYDAAGQNYTTTGATTGNPNQQNVNILSYQVTITVSVELIDRKRNVVLWESSGLVGRGDYRINGEQETDGRIRAVHHLLQQIIDGAQSQW